MRDLDKPSLYLLSNQSAVLTCAYNHHNPSKGSLSLDDRDQSHGKTC